MQGLYGLQGLNVVLWGSGLQSVAYKICWWLRVSEVQIPELCGFRLELIQPRATHSPADPPNRQILYIP